MNHESTWISTTEVAKLLGKDAATINRWTNAGKLTPCFRAQGRNGVRFFDKSEIMSLAAKIDELRNER